MNKISIRMKDRDHEREIKGWLNEHIGMGNYQEWLAFAIVEGAQQYRRTYSFKNPRHETLFQLRWA